MSEFAPQWIELQGGVNARDVAGLPAADGRIVQARRLLRSAHLQHLTSADVDVLVGEYGVRRIVDLRTNIEVDREGPGPLRSVPDVSIHHLSLYRDSESGVRVEPADLDETADSVDAVTGAVDDATATATVDDAAAPEVPNPVMPWHGKKESVRGPVIDSYLRYLESRPDSIVAALRAIAEPHGATLVHCAAGKDRTGVIVALALTVAGVPADLVAADYAATESQLDAIIGLLSRSAIYTEETASPDGMPIPTAANMLAVLDAIEEDFGGIEEWLATQGWTTDDTRRLRDSLLD
ncbi:MAG: protein tyrosine/serine phosphatase [Frankiales bacterium]|nr:protein tyrosine/serine phosphatase [Frankiales bacterium]